MADIDEDYLKKLIYMSAIPKEMFWAYEAVRRSGIWNMFIVHPMFGRYHNGETKEMIQTMDQAYIKFVVYTNADISQSEYTHVTIDHVRLIQHLYKMLSKAYGKEYPEGVVNIKVKRSVDISI